MVCVIPPTSPGGEQYAEPAFGFPPRGVHSLRLSISQLQEELISRKTHGPRGLMQGLRKAVTQASDNQYSNLEFSTLEPECSETHIKNLLMIEVQLIFII